MQHRSLVLLMVAVPGIGLAETEESKDDDQPSAWSGTIGFGVIWLTGNSDLLGITGTTILEYNGDEFAATIEADGVYEKATTEGGTEREVISAAIDGFFRPEYRFTPTWSMYGLIGGEVDRVASLAGRVDAELGVGITLLEPKQAAAHEIFLRLYAGGHFARDFRTDYYPEPVDLEDVDIWGPGAGLTFRVEIFENVEIDELASVVVGLADGVHTIVESTSALTFWITNRLALAVYFNVDVDTDAPPDVDATDTSLSVGLELGI
jgi:putative salt-induced outer membrane protein YdiY